MKAILGFYVSDDYPNQLWGSGRTPIGTGVLSVSRDYGETWENLSENINIQFCCGIDSVIVPSEDENMVLAGFAASIKKSGDGGESWETVMNGFYVEAFLNSLSVPGRI